MKLPITKLIREVTSWQDLASPAVAKERETNSSIFFDSEYRMPRPFKPLPNVSEAKLVTSSMDPLLARGGIAKRLAPDMDFSPYSSRIKAVNRYIWIIQNKLERFLRANRRAHFWVYALLLMKQSNALRMVALRKLNPNWHREYKLGLVKGILTRLREGITNLKTELFIVRDYVPKVKPDGSKSWRPVGAPSLPDRMLLYLWQSFFAMYIAGWISPSQHAYLPGRGVNTATAELEERLSNSKFGYVWEFDLKGAFPSVVIPEAVRCLTEIGFPPMISAYIEKMSTSTIERVDLANQDKVKEAKKDVPEFKFGRQVQVASEFQFQSPAQIKALQTTKLQAMANELMKQFMMNQGQPGPGVVITDFPEDHPDYNPLSQFDFKKVFSNPVPVTPRPDPIGISEFSDTLSSSTHSELQTESLSTFAKTESDRGFIDLENKGFPQGSGLSPILFNIAFDYAALRNHFMKLHPSVRVLSYADDFIVFSEVDLPELMNESNSMNKMGLIFSKEKSRPVRKDGVWLVSKLKYLGLTIGFPSPTSTTFTLQGTPRSGAILDYDKGLVIDQFVRRDESLRIFARKFNLDESPQELLDQWGRAERPGSLVPLDVIKGTRELTLEYLNETQDILDPARATKDKPGVTSAPKSARHSSNRPLIGLQTRLKGLITNRLHGGSWEAEISPANRSLRPEAKTDGGSWIERIRNICIKTPTLSHISKSSMSRVAAMLESYSARNRSMSIYNSTSYATKDLLRITRGDDIKLTKRGIRYAK